MTRVHFHVSTIERDHWSIVAVVGELDLSTVPAARSEVTAAVSRRTPPFVVLDVTGLEFIDSVGLGVVVGALKRVNGAGGELRVAAKEGRVLRAFVLTGLDRLVRMGATVDEVLAAAPLGPPTSDDSATG